MLVFNKKKTILERMIFKEERKPNKTSIGILVETNYIVCAGHLIT